VVLAHDRRRTISGTAARAGEDFKYEKYTDNHVIMQRPPRRFETFGSLGPAGHECFAELATLARPVGHFTPDGKLRLLDYDGLRASFLRQLRGRIVDTSQRGNSLVLLAWASKCCLGSSHAAAGRQVAAAWGQAAALEPPLGRTTAHGLFSRAPVNAPTCAWVSTSRGQFKFEQQAACTLRSWQTTQ